MEEDYTLHVSGFTFNGMLQASTSPIAIALLHIRANTMITRQLRSNGEQTDLTARYTGCVGSRLVGWWTATVS